MFHKFISTNGSDRHFLVEFILNENWTMSCSVNVLSALFIKSPYRLWHLIGKNHFPRTIERSFHRNNHFRKKKKNETGSLKKTLKLALIRLFWTECKWHSLGCLLQICILLCAKKGKKANHFGEMFIKCWNCNIHFI